MRKSKTAHTCRFFRPFLWLGVIALAMFVAGCQWGLKKQCKETNWFDHGFQVAMRGERLSGDQLYSQCKKEEFDVNESQADLGFKAGMERYCKPEVVLNTGKEGNYFNTDFCDPGQWNFLRGKHAEGVRIFCEKSNGYNVGSSGKVYNNICPKQQESAFLSEYRRGRKVWIAQAIVEKQERINNADAEMNQKNSEILTLRSQLMMAGNERRYESRQIFNANTGTYVTQQEEVVDQSVVTRKNQLQNQITARQNQVTQLQEDKKRYQDELFKLRSEQAALEGVLKP